jgi:hypothetical protein
MVAAQTPVKETITVNQVVSENSQQTVVRGTFTIPDPNRMWNRLSLRIRQPALKRPDFCPIK